MAAPNSILVEIKPKIIFYVLLACVLVALAFQIKEVIVVLFIAYILSAGIRPLVSSLEKRKVPRALAILIVYLGVVALLVCSGILIANQLVAQVRLLIQELPTIFDSTIKFLQTQVPWIGSIIPLQSLQTELDSFATGLLQSETVSSAITSDNILTVVSRTIGAFGTVAGLLLQIFTTVMVSLYLVGRRESAHKRLLPFLDKPSAAKFDRIMDRIEVSLGSWVNGQLLLSLIIGVLTYVVMMIPGLFDPSYTLDNFALTVAIIAAIFELLPNIGPTITLILTSILAIGTGGVGGLIYIFITFLAIQNLEATFIVPAVMRRAVDLDPILTILSIIAGFQLAGIMGAVLAVPIVTIVKIIVTELVEMRDTE